jgi:hypothetical protein
MSTATDIRVVTSRMARKIRYMDSRDDEQEWGITMENSAVSLKFKSLGEIRRWRCVRSQDVTKDAARHRPLLGKPSRTYFVNLIDTVPLFMSYILISANYLVGCSERTQPWFVKATTEARKESVLHYKYY